MEKIEQLTKDLNISRIRIERYIEDCERIEKKFFKLTEKIETQKINMEETSNIC